MMQDLFKNEFKRYLGYSLVIMAIHIGFWGYISTQSPVLEQSKIQDTNLNLIMLFVSLSFGILQMALHKRKNHWAYLVHRPLAEYKIHGALVSAGSLLLFMTITLPFLLAMMATDMMTNEVVELRHYLYILHMIMASLVCYFIGIYIVLSPSWGAFLTLGIIGLLSKNNQSPAALTLLTDITLVLATYYLSRRSFKVNLPEHFKRKRDIFLAVLLMQPALAVILVISQAFYYHLPLILVDAHPDQYELSELDDSYAILWRLENDELVDLIAKNSDYRNKEKLAQQAKLANKNYLRVENVSYPIRGQLFNHDKSYELRDEKNKKSWVFSHKEMLFVGRSTDTGEVIGYLGEQGFINLNDAIDQQMRFTEVPTMRKNSFIRTHNKIYIVDFDEQILELKHQLHPQEFYTSKIQIDAENNIVGLLSNKALYFFDLKEFTEENEYAEATHVVPHFRDVENQIQIGYFVLVDGYLLHYSSSHFYGFQKPGTALVHAKHDGSNELIGELSFSKYREIPDWVSDQDYWSSPIIVGTFYSYINGLYSPNKTARFVTLANIDKRIYKSSIYYLILFFAIFSSLVTYLLGSTINISRSNKAFWVTMNFIFGISGLFSFLLMNRWRDELFRKKS